MKLRCAILDDYQSVALKMADWSELEHQINITVFSEHIEEEQALVEAIKDKQIIIIMRERTPFRKSLLKRLPNLKLLITSGSRNAAIDLEAARALGITVCGTASSKIPPLELTWGLMLSLVRHIPLENQAFKSSAAWQSTVGTCLHGKTLGLLGLGKIGTLMVPIAKAFGMKVIAWSQNLTLDKTKSLDVALANSKQELLHQSDIISTHLKLSERTNNLLTEDDLKCMKPSSYLINTSRAAIVNQDALIHALQRNHIAGAGLDVYKQEPLPHDHPLRQLTNVVTTPHLGYVTEENYRIYFDEAIENINSYLNGNPKRVMN